MSITELAPGQERALPALSQPRAAQDGPHMTNIQSSNLATYHFPGPSLLVSLVQFDVGVHDFVPFLAPPPPFELDTSSSEQSAVSRPWSLSWSSCEYWPHPPPYSLSSYSDHPSSFPETCPAPLTDESSTSPYLLAAKEAPTVPQPYPLLQTYPPLPDEDLCPVPTPAYWTPALSRPSISHSPSLQHSHLCEPMRSMASVSAAWPLPMTKYSSASRFADEPVSEAETAASCLPQYHRFADGTPGLEGMAALTAVQERSLPHAGTNCSQPRNSPTLSTLVSQIQPQRRVSALFKHSHYHPYPTPLPLGAKPLPIQRHRNVEKMEPSQPLQDPLARPSPPPSSRAPYTPPSSKEIAIGADGKELSTSEGSLNDLKDPPDGIYGRPPYAYVTLIRYAILGAPDRKLCLQGLYDAIEERYPFFKNAGKGWKNSVRHNLSLNKCFKRQGRRILDPGKGSYWTVDINEEISTSRIRNRKKPKKGDEPVRHHRPVPSSNLSDVSSTDGNTKRSNDDDEDMSGDESVRPFVRAASESAAPMLRAYTFPPLPRPSSCVPRAVAPSAYADAALLTSLALVPSVRPPLALKGQGRVSFPRPALPSAVSDIRSASTASAAALTQYSFP